MDVQGADVIARLEAGLGRRWTTDDAYRVIGWMDVQVETILGPTALERFISSFIDCIADDETEYQDILYRGIHHDLESLRRNNDIPVGIDIDELASDIFDEALGMYFVPEEDVDPMDVIQEESEYQDHDDFAADEFDPGLGFFSRFSPLSQDYSTCP